MKSSRVLEIASNIHLKKICAQCSTYGVSTLISRRRLSAITNSLIAVGSFTNGALDVLAFSSSGLVRATALALREESKKLDWTHLERRALSDAKCAQMAADVKDGEDKLRYAAETNRERLSRVFGVGDVSRARDPDPQEKPQRGQSEAQDISAKKGPQRRVGERAPQRDPVRETPAELPSSSDCPFKGVLEISSDQMKETGVSLVECPDCGRARSLPFSGRTIRFPSHTKRKTSTPNKDERWVKRDERWKLSR